MRVPKDQGLFFTVFLTVCFAIILTAWFFLPIYHREQEEGAEVPAANLEKFATPDELIKKAEKVLLQAESALQQLTSSEKQKPNSPVTSTLPGGLGKRP